MEATNTTMNGIYSDSFSTIVVIESLISCCLSIMGSFIIFGSYLYIPEIRNSTRKLVTCLTVADFLTASGIISSAIAHLLGTQRQVCTVQSGITTFSSLVSFYLTVFIAIHIFSTVITKSDTTSSTQFLIFTNFISWIIPGIIVVVAYENGVLGRDTVENIATGPWCWLKRDSKNYMFWMFATGKAWELLCYILTTSLYVLLKFYLLLKYRRHQFQEIHDSLRNYDHNFLYVWFILYLLRLWGTIRSIMDVFEVDKHGTGEQISDVFMHMQALGDPAQAFCNCILVCFLDQPVRAVILRCFCGKPPRSTVGLQTEENVGVLEACPQNNDATSDGQCYGSIGRHISFE